MNYYQRFWTNSMASGRYTHQDIPDETGFDMCIRQIEKVFKVLPFTPVKCLEVGCGRGFESSLLSKHVWTIATDYAEEPLIDARKAYPDIEFRQADVTALPFKDREFDMVYMQSVMEHILDTEMMFKELNRVLSIGGCVVTILPEHNFLKNLAVLFQWDKFFHPYNSHIRFYSRKTLKKAFEENGFEVLHYEPMIRYFGVPSTMMMIARKIR